MEFVQPIRDVRQIQTIKSILLSQSARNHLLFVLGINSGLRISDILLLRMKDIVDDRGRPRSFYELRERKTNKNRKLPFGRNVQKSIELYVQERRSYSGDQYVFNSRKGGGPITRQRAYQLINAAARAIGIKEKIGTHTLRKTMGYHAYKSGVDISLLQSIFNHSAPSVTLRYIGITQDDIDDVILNLNL